MLCPECKKSSTKVIDSRDDSRSVRRRRVCLSCHCRFTTHEYIEPPKLKILKRNGVIEEYSRTKMQKGINLALEKRPVSAKQVSDAVDTIERNLYGQKNKLVQSKFIGNLVLEMLKKLDEVAYLRFLSVYRSFGSASMFQKEAEKLKKIKH
ncbi:MAG: transcriptional regulator NrdR [Candidatus Berkelbacteria bacterium]